MHYSTGIVKFFIKTNCDAIKKTSHHTSHNNTIRLWFILANFCF